MADFFDRKQQNKGEIAIGLDLTDTYSQLSYMYVDSDAADTLSNAGAANLLIPTALFTRSEVNQWFAGKDAVNNKDNEGYFFDKLVTLARNGEMVEAGDASYDPCALLTLYIKRVLALINNVSSMSKVVSFMITVPVLDHVMIEVLNKTVAGLGLKNISVSYQSHVESFYYYMLYQPAQLWNRNVLLLHADGEKLKSYKMECNKNTTPIVVFIDENEREFADIAAVAEPDNNGDYSGLDKDVCDFAEGLTQDRVFSSVYLIGDAFKGDWYKETQRLLCKKARVFQGNNLFSKGAAFSARNKYQPTILSSGHVFLGQDKLKTNVGMNVCKRGENSYLALLNAGINWFDAGNEIDVIVPDNKAVSLVLTPLNGKNAKMAVITLDGLPDRPSKTSRVHITLSMEAEGKLKVNIKDLGFGELFPSSNMEWNEVIDV